MGDPTAFEDPAEDYKNRPGLAMDRSPALQAALMRMAPEWLTIGENLKARVRRGRLEDTEWAIENRLTSQGTPAKVAFYGDDLVLPPHESGWSHAIASPGRDRILLVPKDALGDVSLFSVMDGKIVAGSRQDVPAVNYDDPRRWFVSWQHFLSDSWLVGCMNEEDASGHIVVRSSLYAYDVVERSLHRIEIPDPFPEVFQQGIYIQGVSQSSILISTEDGEYTILIE